MRRRNRASAADHLVDAYQWYFISGVFLLAGLGLIRGRS